jgi:hypothetical protein
MQIYPDPPISMADALSIPGIFNPWSVAIRTINGLLSFPEIFSGDCPPILSTKILLLSLEASNPGAHNPD